MLSVCSRRDAQLQRVSKGPFWKWWSVALLTNIATESQPGQLEWKIYNQITRRKLELIKGNQECQVAEQRSMSTQHRTGWFMGTNV